MDGKEKTTKIMIAGVTMHNNKTGQHKNIC